MQNKLYALQKAIQDLSIDDFRTKEEYRKYVVKSNRQLSSKLSEGAEDMINKDDLVAYIKVLMQEGYLEQNKLPSVPENLKAKERSKAHKSIFQEELLNYEYPDNPRLNKMLVNSIKTSSCISELRSALKFWQEVQLLYAEMDKLEDTVRILDKQIKFDTEQDDLLEFYKQQNKELIEALTEQDEEYLLAKKVHGLRKQGKGRYVIAKELGVTDRQVRTLIENYEFQ